MTREERSKLLDKLEQLRFFNQRAGRELWSDKSQELQDEDIKNADTILDMAISALKDIEDIQFIVDTYFTRGSKSGYECMGEIDRILEPYQKGGE